MKTKVFLLFVACTVLISISLRVPRGEADYSGVSFSDITLSALPRVLNVRSYGVSLGDYNLDGYEDLYINNHQSHPPSLLKNNGDSNFSLGTISLGSGFYEDQHGSAWGDYDNDGDLDLYQSVGGGDGLASKCNLLYRNNGGGFLDVAEESGVCDPKGRSRSVGWLDFNNDGNLDLFIANADREDGPNALFQNNGDLTFTNVSEHAGVADTTAEIGLSFADFDMDGFVDILLTSPARIYLYRNMGDGTFLDVTKESFEYDPKEPLKNPSGCAWGDYDNDGDLDLFIATTNGRGDALYADDEKIVFETRERLGEDCLGFITTGKNVTFDLYFWMDTAETDRIFIGKDGVHPESVPFILGESSDIDPLGRPKNVPIYSSHVYSIWQNTDGIWFICQRGRLPRYPRPGIFRGFITSDGCFTNYKAFDYEFKEVSAKNYLFENLGDGSFADVTIQAGLEDNLSSQSALWADFDNDGDLDLYVVNNGDIFNEPNSYYVNNGDGTFTECAKNAGVEAVTEGNGDSAAFGDINNDGFLDIIVINGLEYSLGPYVFFKNDGNGNNWIKIKLVGYLSNRDGIGTKIFLKTPAGNQFREQNGGSHLRSQNSMIIHFGLGAATFITELKVVWPSGTVQTFYDVDPNQVLEIHEVQ